MSGPYIYPEWWLRETRDLPRPKSLADFLTIRERTVKELARRDPAYPGELDFRRFASRFSMMADGQGFADLAEIPCNIDGTTDDTSNIQSALNSMPDAGGVLFCPRGHYRVDSTLNIPASATTGFSKNILIVGEGEGTVASPGGVAGGATVFDFSQGTLAAAGIDAQNGGDSATEGQNSRWMGGIEKLALHGSGLGAGSVGLLTGDILDSSFFRFRTRGFQDGVRVEGDCYYSTFLKCRWTGAGRDAFSVGDPAGTKDSEVNAVDFYECIAHTCGRYGIAFSPNTGKWMGQPLYITKCFVEQCDEWGIYIRNCRHTVIHGGYIEFNGNSGTAGIGNIFYHAQDFSQPENLLVLRDVYFNSSSAGVAAGVPNVGLQVPSGANSVAVLLDGCAWNPKDGNSVFVTATNVSGGAHSWPTGPAKVTLTAIANKNLDMATDACALTDQDLANDFRHVATIDDDFAENTSFPTIGTGNRTVVKGGVQSY